MPVSCGGGAGLAGRCLAVFSVMRAPDGALGSKTRLVFDKNGRVQSVFACLDFCKMNSDNDALQQRVAAHPFLKGMEAHQIAVLSQSATPAHFSAGQIIFQTGEPANGFYLVERGSVVLEAPQPGQASVVIDVVAAGEPLGWSWLFPPYAWQFDARATEPTDALCFSGILLRQHRDEDLMLSHELFKRMSNVMVRRLQHARTQLATAKQLRSVA